MPSMLTASGQAYPSVPLLIAGCVLITVGAIPLGSLMVATHAARHGVFGGPVAYRPGEPLADSQRRAEQITRRLIDRRTRRKRWYWISILAGVLVVVVSALV